MTESLYKIGEQIAEIEALDLTEEEKLDTLDAIDAQFDQKAEAVAAYIKDLELKAKNANDEAKRLQERSKDLLKQADKMSEYLKLCLQGQGKTKIVGSLFTVSIQKGRESVVVDDIEKLDDRFVTVKKEVKPNKRAMKEHFDKGLNVFGAHIERGEDKVRIK